MADGENQQQTQAEVDPFKDFIQSEYKDGIKIEPAKPEPTAEEKAAAAAAAAAPKKEEADEFEPPAPEADDPNASDDEKARKAAIREEAVKLAKSMAQGRIGQLTKELNIAKRKLAPPAPAAPAAAATTEPPKGADGKPLDDRAILEQRFAADPTAPKEPDASKYEFGDVDKRYLSDYNKFAYAREKWIDKAAGALSNERAIEAARTQGVKDFATKLEAFHEKGAAVEGYAEAKAAIEKDQFPVSEPVANLILESDVGHELAVHLHKNPTLAQEISELPEYRQVARVALLEAELAAKKAGTPKPAARTASEAPAPVIVPKGNGGSVPVEESTDFTAFEAKANATLGRKT